MSQGYYDLEKELVSVQTRIADLSAQSLDLCMRENMNFQKQVMRLLWFNCFLEICFVVIIISILAVDSNVVDKIFRFFDRLFKK